jgi:hypothetical protein
MPDPVRRIAGKLLNNAKLLRQDPERFARNLLQFTNPALFEQRLADVMATVPMQVRISEGGDPAPRLNVLDSAWTQTGMTGGPNTIINLACRVARHGVAVRLVSTRQAETLDPAWFRRHAESLVGSSDFPAIDVVSAARPEAPLELGPGDMFLATHWSTAQQLKAVLPAMRVKRFFYMLQEFEPGFYAWSSNFALALETYGLDFWPIVNEAVLADYLLGQPFGGLSDPATRQRAIVFEPAVDRQMFYPPAHEKVVDAASARPRRLLFYARPTNTRNMFGLGLLALRAVAADPAWEGWEFLSIGSRGSVGTLDLGAGRRLCPAPWRDYAGYGDTLREADILLCPMISPHTSYPVLEMAACGGLAVTNTFATKTSAVLAALSENIVAVPPTVEGMAEGLLSAARMVAAGRARRGGVNLPGSWAEALDPVAARVAGILQTA